VREAAGPTVKFNRCGLKVSRVMSAGRRHGLAATAAVTLPKDKESNADTFTSEEETSMFRKTA
jgi:hypothetical protein